jgi:hypothetical protein
MTAEKISSFRFFGAFPFSSNRLFTFSAKNIRGNKFSIAEDSFLPGSGWTSGRSSRGEPKRRTAGQGEIDLKFDLSVLNSFSSSDGRGGGSKTLNRSKQVQAGGRP